MKSDLCKTSTKISKRRILFFLQTPPPIHGSSIVGESIKKSQLINDAFNNQYININISQEVNEVGGVNIKKLFRYLFILWCTFSKLIFFNPNLCYVAITSKGIAFYKDVFLILLIKLFRKKIIYHFHNKGVSQGQNNSVNKFFYNLVFANTKAILLSQYLFYDIEHFFPTSNVHICPNGISNLYKGETKTTNPNKPPQILFLSNLIETKGVFILLEACAILKHKGLIFQCTFVGGEGNISSAKFNSKAESLNITSNVTYLGKKTGIEKDRVFCEADIFAFPTFYELECFPLVLLEAMQYKLPIVTTLEGGIKDIVKDGETGFLVPQRNVKILADKIEYLIKNTEIRLQMGEAGRKKYEESFTLNKFENNIIQILDNELNIEISG